MSFWFFVFLAVIIVVVILVLRIRKGSTGSNTQEIYYEGNQQGSNMQHSQEYWNVYSNINNMSKEELDEIAEKILDCVLIKKMALGALSDKPEFLEKYRNFDQAPIEGGPIYGCYTNGEALELQEAINKRLNSFSPNNR